MVPAFFILLACAIAPDKGKEQPMQLFPAEGTFLDCFGAKLVLLIHVPEFSKTSDSVVVDVANQVVRKSYLLEGIKIFIDGRESAVTEVRGNQVEMNFDQVLTYTPGRKLSVQVPKKTIAVVDFEVIGGVHLI